MGTHELLDYTRQGAWLTGGTLAAYLYGLARYGMGPRSGGIAFNTLMLAQLLHALSCRSRHPDNTPQRNGQGGSLLQRAVGGSIALQAAANIIPFLRRMLGLEAGMRAADAAFILAGAGLPFLCNEVAKKGRASAPNADIWPRFTDEEKGD